VILIIEQLAMKFYLSLILFFSSFIYAQNYLPNDSITTENGAQYNVSQQIKYTNSIQPENEGKVFIELHLEQTPADFPQEDFSLRDSTQHFIAYIVNGTKKTLSFQLQDGSLFMIQEAQNKEGKWIPIEHWEYSWCGNSYDSWLKLNKKHYAAFPVRRYSGSYKTKIRLKMIDNKKIYYSNSFDGEIDPSHFKNSNWKKSENEYISYFDENE
jgi:hypothetical protein